MIRNYIKITLRHFRRNQFISLINLLGLSLGLATCLVAGLYIKHELSADKFHEDLNSIYRITVQMKQYSMNGTPYLFAETAEKEIPGIISSLKTSDQESFTRINNETFKHNILFADPKFLTFFTFPLASGNRENALSGLKQVVISHEMKEKYFPDTNPLGQTIQIEIDNQFQDFEISGVAKPTPSYSSMYFDFVVPLENKYAKDPKLKEDWGRFFLTTFVKTTPENLTAIENAMPAFSAAHFPNDRTPEGKPSFNFVLNPFADHHLREGFDGGGLRGGKNGRSLIVFAGIAMVILLLACFNFMNLTNAQSSRRVIEVGIKKVVGAMRFQLMRQFLTEALTLSVIAAIIALGIAELCLFVFTDLLQASISLFDGSNIDVYAGLVIVTLFTGVLAGIYPALVLSNLNTISTFKKHFRVGGSNWVTRSILSLQFGLSIILIVCAIVMWKQQRFIAETDLGYNEEQILRIDIQEKDTASIRYLKNEIKKLSEVVNATSTSSALTLGSNVTIFNTEDGRSLFINLISIDEDYLSTLEMDLVKGENFKSGSGSISIIVNETFVRELNLEDSIGMPLGRNISHLDNPTILGVVKDFHHSAMKYEIAPLMFLYDDPFNSYYLMARLSPGQTTAGLQKIRSVWEKTVPNSPFEFSFLDDNVNKQYDAEVRWSSIISLATGMAIFLSILGLIGLAMFTAEKRRKEIGIRKVLGASMSQLVNLLSRDYMWLIAIAFVMAIPLSYYVMTNYWLNNFAYKIEIDFVIYALALLAVIAVTALSIGSQTIRAAMQNPADTLKEE